MERATNWPSANVEYGVLIFSKDRAFQLDATLRSFCNYGGWPMNLPKCPIWVVYAASTEAHAAAYSELFTEHPYVTPIREGDFKADVLAVLRRVRYVLFLVDDNIFVRRYDLDSAVGGLQLRPEALGFSLRLGRNTSYCYSLNRAQANPAFIEISNRTLSYRWVGAESDFGYPLEVSSSLYRVSDLLPILEAIPFRHPNSLEGLLAEQAPRFEGTRPVLLCYEQSVTFCAPINRVQNYAANRAGETHGVSAEDLLALYQTGARLDWSKYTDFVPNACHQEVELAVRASPSAVSGEQPKAKPFKVGPTVSVVVSLNGDEAASRATIEHIYRQRFQDFEIVLVSDGMPLLPQVDGSFTAQTKLKYFEHLRPLGAGAVKNTGLRHASGTFVTYLGAGDRPTPDHLYVLLERAVTLGAPVVCSQPGNASGRTQFQDAPVLSGMLHRRDCIDEVGPFDESLPNGAEVKDFWQRLLQRYECAHVSQVTVMPGA